MVGRFLDGVAEWVLDWDNFNRIMAAGLLVMATLAVFAVVVGLATLVLGAGRIIAGAL